MPLMTAVYRTESGSTVYPLCMIQDTGRPLPFIIQRGVTPPGPGAGTGTYSKFGNVESVSDIGSDRELLDVQNDLSDYYINASCDPGTGECEADFIRFATPDGAMDGIYLHNSPINLAIRGNIVAALVVASYIRTYLYHRTTGGTETLLYQWQQVVNTTETGYSHTTTPITQGWGASERLIMRATARFVNF